MSINKEAYLNLLEELEAHKATLVAVSKTKPVEDMLELYQLGQRDFGENYVQELVEKQPALPADIRWHFIGHLQTNKVKYIVPLVYLIHGVDSLKLLKEINKQANKINKVVSVLLQVHIASEETKFGFDENELEHLWSEYKTDVEALQHIKIIGLMGMASFSSDETLVLQEFQKLDSLFKKFATQPLSIAALHQISMGMSGDYKLALQQGSNMVRIGSLLFGKR